MPHNFVTVPLADRYRIANARVPVDLAPELTAHANSDRIASCDIVIEAGRIAALAAPGSGSAKDLPVVDLRDGIALPRFVDMHTHIDKGHIWARRPNPDGSFFGARSAVAADREAQLERRGRARPHGFLAPLCVRTTAPAALRTHLDSIGTQTDDLLAGVRGDCARPGRTASRCRRSRCFRPTSRSTTSRSSARS